MQMCIRDRYITLREAVPRDAVGRKLGDIQTLAAVDGEGRVVDTCGVTLSFSALARLEERLPAVSYTHLEDDIYKSIEKALR